MQHKHTHTTEQTEAQRHAIEARIEAARQAAERRILDALARERSPEAVERRRQAAAYSARLVAWMDGQGMTAPALAARLGVSPSTVYTWRAPSRRTRGAALPRAEYVAAIAALGGPDA